MFVNLSIVYRNLKENSEFMYRAKQKHVHLNKKVMIVLTAFGNFLCIPALYNISRSRNAFLHSSRSSMYLFWLPSSWYASWPLARKNCNLFTMLDLSVLYETCQTKIDDIIYEELTIISPFLPIAIAARIATRLISCKKSPCPFSWDKYWSFWLYCK